MLSHKTRFSYGNANKNKTYCLIGRSALYAGVTSTVMYMLPDIYWAVEKGYIPVMDFTNVNVPLWQNESRRGLENAWEYYFEQPWGGETLENVYQSKHVIRLIECPQPWYTPDWQNFLNWSQKDVIFWGDIWRKYVRLNSKLAKRLEEEKRKLFVAGKRTLGVSIRAGMRWGIMLKEDLYNGHPYVDTCEAYIKKTRSLLQEWKCDYVFLGVDDWEYRTKFQEAFGDLCHILKRDQIIHFFDNDKPNSNIEIGNDVIKRNEEYLIETYLLAQCECLYGSQGGQ